MGHPSKFLVVDDEPQILDLLTEFFSSQGHSIRVAGNGEQALDLLQQESFDGVLTDLKMPKLGGLELLQVIKLAYPALPVIIITGYPSFEDAVEAMRKGAADFITKPLRLDELKLAISKVARPCKPVHLEYARSYESSLVTPTVLPSLHGKMKELSALYSISEAFQDITDTESTFQHLVQLAQELVGAQGASFMILDRETHRTPLKTVNAVDELHAGQERHLLLPLDDHMLGRVVHERTPLLYSHDKAVVLVPVLIKNELLGVLSVWGKEGKASFTEDEVLRLLTLCRKASLSIENQFLYESLYQSMIETLKALVTTLESRDPYTRAHSQRVSHYATALAAKVGCNQEEQDIITVAGFLHDIGKVGICDAILLKTGPLTPEEYEIIKTHPVIGEQIVHHLGYFAREKAIIRHHHERWDGYGYPDGLKEDNIPFLARILAVADAFDAITSDRPYRDRRSTMAAIEELECCAGIQFDPELVIAFRYVIEHDLPSVALTF